MFIAFLTAGPAAAGGNLGNQGTFDKWARVEVEMTGPASQGNGNPNPFAIEVDVTFTAPRGTTFVVPAFYDGNGSGGLDGNVWKVRFSADETGTWSFASTSANGQLDGYSGSFVVRAAPSGAPDYYRWGRLEYVGTPANGIRYLKFRDGSYWLKAGCDDPENFLGDFANYDTLAERKSAVDYLSARGVNSIYVMTHNIDGDGKDVWPWLGNDQATAKNNGGADSRFDVAKLDEWLDLFEYMQQKGVVAYIILQDDASWSNYDHERYYREMVARFGHLPALLFNFMEEHNERYSLGTALDWMQVLADLDPYDHPRGIHNVNAPQNQYVDAAHIDFTAIQTQFQNALSHNERTIDWINDCKARNKRVLMVNFDEPRPLMDRKGWWSAYIGGGVWEVHTDQPYDRPMSAWETSWNQIGGARAFMETLPFWEMEPANNLVQSGQAFCLADPGEAYALYLHSGGTIEVDLTSGVTYEYAWWNPANDQNGSFQGQGSVQGGRRSFTAPGGGDWALRIVRTGGQGNSPPIASDSDAVVAPGQSVQVTLAYSDTDGPGPYTFTILQQPSQGALSGSGQTRTYTASATASGADSFRWRVNDGADDSNQATVTITIDSGNAPPSVENQSVTTQENTPVS
ncbi:MAG: DUF5060 domain-containing protein, partial [Planctomycetota bacterium]